MDIAKKLVRCIVRGFYDTKHVLVIDALMIHEAIRDDDLAHLLGFQTKDLHKLCGKLREDLMLAVSTRMEQKDGQQRPVNRTYYYVDFRAAIDAIKYKMHEVTKELEKKMNKDADTKGYVCPRCDKQFTALDAMTLINPFGLFECDRCNTELVDDNDSAEVQTSQERLGRFNDQTKKVLQLLRQIDEVVVPASSFEDAFAKAVPVSREKHGLMSGPNVMSAPSQGKGQMTQEGPKQTFEVKITSDEEKSAAEMAAEQQKKIAQQNQNALPIWHTTSTVTGDITSAGLKEQKERQERERQLQGLGAGLADTSDGKVKPEGDADSALSADAVAQFYADFERREKEKQQEEDEEEEDEDDEDDDDEEFVEVLPATIPSLPPAYNSTLRGDDSDGTGTPQGEDDRPFKRTKVDENEDSEEEEADFEDAL